MSGAYTDFFILTVFTYIKTYTKKRVINILFNVLPKNKIPVNQWTDDYTRLYYNYLTRTPCQTAYRNLQLFVDPFLCL